MVIGVDPSATMLGYARRQRGAEAVTWIHGDATLLDGRGDAAQAVPPCEQAAHCRLAGSSWTTDPKTMRQVFHWLLQTRRLPECDPAARLTHHVDTTMGRSASLITWCPVSGDHWHKACAT
ncbi:hypothetical protein GCM10009872_38130 [Actinopolymorpha rutila]